MKALTDLKLKTFLLPAAILILAMGALAAYLVRGGFRQLEIMPYPVPPSAFTNWNDVLAHPRDISVTTLQTGVIHMDACLNLDPASPKQADCDHVPRDLAVLVHWVHHPHFGDFLVDAGFDDSFAKNPPYGNYTEAMKLFNWANGVTNRQEPGADLAAQLARLNVHPKTVFFTHFHPDHTGGVPALEPRNRVRFRQGRSELLGMSRCLEPLFRQVKVLRHRFFGRACDGTSRPKRGRLRRWILLGDLGARPHRR